MQKLNWANNNLVAINTLTHNTGREIKELERSWRVGMHVSNKLWWRDHVCSDWLCQRVAIAEQQGAEWSKDLWTIRERSSCSLLTADLQLVLFLAIFSPADWPSLFVVVVVVVMSPSYQSYKLKYTSLLSLSSDWIDITCRYQKSIYLWNLCAFNLCFNSNEKYK